MFKRWTWLSLFLQSCHTFTASSCGSFGVQDLACERRTAVPHNQRVISGIDQSGKEQLLQGLHTAVVCATSIRASYLITPSAGAPSTCPLNHFWVDQISLCTKTKSVVCIQVGSDSFSNVALNFLCEDPSWMWLVWQDFSSWSAAVKLSLLRWASEACSSMTTSSHLLEETLQVCWLISLRDNKQWNQCSKWAATPLSRELAKVW